MDLIELYNILRNKNENKIQHFRINEKFYKNGVIKIVTAS
jgi:hypothetical protein